MKLTTKIRYYKSFIPYRCRKKRWEEVIEEIKLNIKEVSFSELKLKYSWDYEQHYDLYEYKGKLYRKSVILKDFLSAPKFSTSLEALKWYYQQSCYSANSLLGFYYHTEDKTNFETKEMLIKRVRKESTKYLIVDGEIYIQTNKPLYHVCTFGLGNNHGGTACMISQSKFSAKKLNKEYKHECYFEAEDYEKAFNNAIEVALNRGDSYDVERFKISLQNKKYLIKIY